ncbi:MAG: hypothetical protein GXC78_13135 [Chitinophagaceae bacterium]|nr:hypothetical protein [Chitinophagaceae bacterium]
MVSIPLIGVVMNWRNENNKSGLYPVHIRVKQGNIARYYNVPLPQKIKESEWAGKEDAWVKPSHPYAFECNNKILEIKCSIKEYIKRCLNFNKPVTIFGIIEHLGKKGHHLVIDFP